MKVHAVTAPIFTDRPACIDHTELFDKNGAVHDDAKRAICEACLCLIECFSWSLNHVVGNGFWAGHNSADRARLRRLYNITPPAR